MSTERSGFDLDLFFSSTFLDFLFSCSAFCPSVWPFGPWWKSHFMTVYFWAAKYFTWLLSLYHGGHLCLIPSELFALAWLPFSLASAPWAANYLGFGFYIRVWRSFFPNIPSELFALAWLPFGLASAPRARRLSCISKYFWALPCPFGSPRRKEWNGNLKCIVNLFRPLSYILTRLPSAFVEPVEFFMIIFHLTNGKIQLV